MNIPISCEQEEQRDVVSSILAIGKKYLSKKTGFIHLCSQEEEYHKEVIPFLENMHYVLALLSSRLLDNVIEAKGLLSRLLPFEVSGNFPIYLHEFPACHSRTLPLDLLLVFASMVENFQLVLGEELRLSILEVIERLKNTIDISHDKLPFPPVLWMKRSVLENNLSCAEWIPRSSQDLGHFLMAWQLQKEETRGNISWIGKYFHHALGIYVGPQGKECMFGDTFAPTFFDIFMSKWHGEDGPKLDSSPSLALQSISCLPCTMMAPPSSQKDLPYLILQETSPLCTLFWGSRKKVHSLLFHEGKNLGKVEKIEKGVRITLDLIHKELEEPFTSGFFLNLDPSHSVFIEGKKATTFQPLETVEILTEGQRVCSLSVHVQKGSGTFFGHISRSNRPRQLKKEQLAHRYEAYDLFIAVRAIKRSEECHLEWILTF